MILNIEFPVEIPDGETLRQLLGEGDAVRRAVEKQWPVRLAVREGQLFVSGEEKVARRAGALLVELTGVARASLKGGRAVSAADVEYLARREKHGAAVSQPGKLMSDIVVVSERGKRIGPRTEGQGAYVEALRRSDMIFAIGPAGTGKTYLAVAAAVAALKDKKVARVILTRPAVEAGENLGFLPGDLEAKIDPYLRPLYDALYEMLDMERAEKLFEKRTIEVAPLAFMRGRTLNDAFVILDEAQNTTPAQMKMFLTRLGFGSKMVVTGDITQTDLPRGQESGLVVASQVLPGVRGVEFVHLGKADVVRHDLVQRIIDAYESHDA